VSSHGPGPTSLALATSCWERQLQHAAGYPYQYRHGFKCRLLTIPLSEQDSQVCGLSLPYTLPAGQSTDLSITFCPTSGARVTGSATAVSNASDSPATVSLSGTGQHNVRWWSPSSSGGLTEYDVCRSPARSGPYTQITSVASTRYTGRTVAAGQKCYYQVTAVILPARVPLTHSPAR